MMIHPQFDPVLISIGPLAIRWYALSYIVGFMLFLWLGRRRIAQGNTLFTREMLDDFLTWGILGVIIGGRLGYVLFYKFSTYIDHPLDIFKVWEGGMSFHGGFLGVLAAMWLFSRKHKISFLKTMDFVAPLVPLGLASGRIGNFINGELWGRVTDINAFWAMGFPQAHYEDVEAAAHNPLWAEWLQQYAMLPRHPSQLYQFALEGICLFIVLWIFSKKTRPDGQVASLFLAGYGFFRFLAEFARQPDDYLGLLTLGLSMGQWLSVPMIVLGAIGFVWFGRRGKAA
ncbi:prolipoprotein diacylglyceryl transferase [Neisseria sp. oral taxon 014 str. F0314]|uniref:prolipoprotein diacylglyceryl transferase n=1 Tax=Neisseria sp. oral taxon 014 TaxID=641148 RepID=UPI0001D8C4AD|nr:prolipoprotein diacylglyceryl transferase [Neisseria sp. oral taxon 014]EFI24291.1 prolipoprotein diacylglyceryl transferase [Neisseria sp. oral taxon 014 str. F0314]